MARIAKDVAELEQNFVEAIDLLEAQCRSYDSGFASAAKVMSNLLHQLVDERGQNKSHLAKLGIEGTFQIALLPLPKPVSPTEYSNSLVSLIFGIARKPMTGEMIPAATLPPAHLEQHVIRANAEMKSVSEWLDLDAIQLPDGRKLSRRDLIRQVRDTDAGAHSDVSLNDVYVAFKQCVACSPQSSVEIKGKVTNIVDLLPNPALASLRQISHEFLSSVYSIGSRYRPPVLRCIVYEYDAVGVLKAIHRPIGYPKLPLPVPSNLVVPH